MYQVNGPRVVHETIDGETVIIDTLTGVYFTASGSAATLWQALAEGADPVILENEFVRVGGDAVGFAAFLNDLVSSQLVVPRTGGAAESNALPRQIDATAPALTRHDELQDLIELDPIHEVDTAQGWPFRDPDVK
jgi:hypothetical protein